MALNRAALALAGGFTEEELIGVSFADLLHPDDLDRVGVDFAAMLGQESRTIGARVIRKDGSVIELQVIGLPVVVDGVVIGIYGIAEDVTERRRVQQFLADARVAAEQANEAKSRFLATMSHEIRTPLSSVLAAVELLGETTLSEQQQRLLDVMERAGDRLHHLVEEVLVFSKIEAGIVEVAAETFSLQRVIDELSVVMTPRMDERRLSFTCSLDPQLPAECVGDADRIGQVLTNLVSNAAKFTPAGSVTVTVEAVGSREDSVDVRFAVKDTGIGLTNEQQRLVFEPFHQADSSSTRAYGGTGLGLSISRDLVTLMGGTLDVWSSPGTGATFSAVLPLGRVLPRPAP